MQRVVIVTPSVYGTDNSATLYGMKARGADARAWPSSTTRRRTRSSTPWRGPECAASGSISRPAAQPTRRQGAGGSKGRSSA